MRKPKESFVFETIEKLQTVSKTVKALYMKLITFKKLFMEKQQKEKKSKKGWWKYALVFVAGVGAVVAFNKRHEIADGAVKVAGKIKKNFNKKASDAPKVISDNISDQPVRRPENHGKFTPYSERFKKINS